MSTFYNILSQIQGVNGYGLPPSDLTFSVTLGAAANTQLTASGSSVPGFTNGNKLLAIFQYADAKDIWININANAAAPAGAAFAAGSMLNPSALLLSEGDVINAFSTGGADMSVSFYAIKS